MGGITGYTVLPTGIAIPVHSKGGWGQLTLLATPRLSFHIFSGLEDGRDGGSVALRDRPELVVRGEFLLSAGAQRFAWRRSITGTHRLY